MKKILKLGSILFVILFLCSCGKNGSLGLSAEGSSGIKKAKEDYSNKIEIDASVAANGEIIVKAENTSNKNLDIEAEISFYDEEKNLVDEKDIHWYNIFSGAKVIEDIDPWDLKFDTYRIEVKSAKESPDEEIPQDKIKIISTNDTGKKITAQVSNEYEKDISITINTLYYKENKIIGSATEYEDIKVGDISNVSFYYPEDDDGDVAKFDQYEVFISEVLEEI